MSQLRPIKRKLDQEELCAVFDRDHWHFLRKNDVCHEVINYFDGSFAKLDHQEAVAVFSELEPAFVNYRTAEQNAVGHMDASAVEDFIFQVGVMFRTLEQSFSAPKEWLKPTFRIPEVRTRVVNPFDISPSVFKELGSHSSSAPPSKKSRSAPAAPADSDEDFPADPCPGLRRSTRDSRPVLCGNYKRLNAKVVIETPAPSTPSPKKTGKARQPNPPPGSPSPTSKTRNESDEDSIQVIQKPADHHPVARPSEFDPSAIAKANLRFKGKGSKPSVPLIAPTVVPKHQVVLAALPAEDARSLVPCYDCLSRVRICMFTGINKRCYNCVRNGQACTNGAQSFPAMVALDRLEPVLATTSRRFNTHLKNLAHASRLVQVHQEFVSRFLQDYLDSMKDFAFEFFQAEKVLSPAHFKRRFQDTETQDTIRDLFKRFEITFEDACEHYLLTHPVEEILESDDSEAMHIPPVDPALASPLERSAPPVLPDAIRASYSTVDLSNSDMPDISVTRRTGLLKTLQSAVTGPSSRTLESVPVVPSMKVGPPIHARRDETPQPSVSSLGSLIKPNPFSRPPRNLQAINRELSAPPSIATLRNEVPPSPEMEPVDDDMGEGTDVGPSGVEEVPLGATARLFLHDMSLL
ncbi:hypothetical protein DFH07DRAFT_959598 [Mycena maculata]|uniref:Uncharacterized protein n=1 Tax=Mycena maculata TaxID=230809 RepID=A0AAD7J3G4_9AGAR|nr:hypothetical protein DFH07DRAFT_959598 [Mycena maculata]